jgi:hypothetical protein
MSTLREVIHENVREGELYEKARPQLGAVFCLRALLQDPRRPAWCLQGSLQPRRNAVCALGLRWRHPMRPDREKTTLVYSVIIEIFGFWCPLTKLETWLDMRGGVSTYRGPFLVHYLDAVVYPNISPKLLIAGAVAVCVLNLWIYARRVRVRHSLG